MTLFRFDLLRIRKHEDASWDGMKPPGLSIVSLYYDLKWHNRLNKVDGMPFRNRFAFVLLKILQIIAYGNGWRNGGKR